MSYDGRFKVGCVYVSYDRASALRSMSESHVGVFDISPAGIDDAFSDWIVAGLETVHGAKIGACLVKDGEGHIGILPAFRGAWGGTATIRALCNYFKVSRTSAMATHDKANGMLVASGFRMVSSANGVNYYQL